MGGARRMRAVGDKQATPYGIEKLMTGRHPGQRHPSSHDVPDRGNIES